MTHYLLNFEQVQLDDRQNVQQRFDESVQHSDDRHLGRVPDDGEGLDPARPLRRDGRVQGQLLAGAGALDQVRGEPAGGRRAMGKAAHCVTLLSLGHQLEVDHRRAV